MHLPGGWSYLPEGIEPLASNSRPLQIFRGIPRFSCAAVVGVSGGGLGVLTSDAAQVILDLLCLPWMIDSQNLWAGKDSQAQRPATPLDAQILSMSSPSAQSVPA